MSGHEGLQPERTSLAWRRTGLVGTVAALALARAAMIRGSLVFALLCIPIVVAAVATLVEGTRALPDGPTRLGAETAGPVLPLAATVTTAVTVLLAVVGLGLVVVD